MKKLFLFLILLSSFAYSQAIYSISGTLPRDYNSVPSTIGVQINGDGTFSLSHYTYISPSDTLTGIDSSMYDFSNRAFLNEINIYNPAANADTLVPYYWDMGNSRWTSQMSAVYDFSVADWLTADASTGLIYIIIPAKTSKRFMLAEHFASKVKLKPQVTTGQGSDTLILNYIEKQ